MRLVSQETMAKRRGVYSRYPGVLLPSPKVCNPSKTGIYTLGSMLFGGPGSGRHPGSAEYSKDWPKGRDSVSWAVHPEGGLIFDPSPIAREHTSWFGALGMPTSGPAFDKIERGNANISPYRKEVRVCSYQEEAVPPDLQDKIYQGRPEAKDYKWTDYSYGMRPSEVAAGGPGRDLAAVGTSEGAIKGWDTRGRGQHTKASFHDAMLQNLSVMSRTSKGIGRESDRPSLTKEGQELAKHTHDNFERGVDWIWEHKDTPVTSGKQMRDVIETLGKIANEGLIKQGQSFYRTWEDQHYAPVDSIQKNFDEFSQQLSQKITDPDVAATAAWSERRFNEIHPLADGVGRTNMLLAGFICAKNTPLPAYKDRAEYFQHINKGDFDSYYKTLVASGTSEGAIKGWDTRGRKQKDVPRSKTGAFDKRFPKTMAFYHGTTAEVEAAVLKEGLIPGKGAGGDAWMKKMAPTAYQMAVGLHKNATVYMTPDLQTAEEYAGVAEDMHPGSKGVVFKIDVPLTELPPRRKGKVELDEADDRAVRYKGRIPPEWISVVEEGRFRNPHDPSEIEREARYQQLGFSGQLVKYAVIICQSDVQAYGTSEGADKAWDTRGRGRKGVVPNVRQPAIPATPEGVTPATQENPQVQLKPSKGMQQENPGGVSFQPSDRMLLALQNRVPCGAEKQRIADQMEQHLSKVLGIPRTSDNKPFDLTNNKVGVEVKCMQDSKNGRVTMSKDALARKMDAMKQTGVKGYTIVADKRQGQTQYYVKKGFGSFRLGGMNPISIPDLKKMIGGAK